jgi:ribonuclease D
MSSTDGVLVNVNNVEKVFHRGSEEIHVLQAEFEVAKGEFWP